MADPIPGQEAIDNGDGTATTRYTDGSSTVWNIDTGQYVSSTPAGGGGAPTSLAGAAGGTQAAGSYYRFPGTPSPSWWNAPTNPMSIGAGTSEQGYGWGVPGFGQQPIGIRPEYLDYLSTAPGYIPGSGTFNQYRLDQPGLVGTLGGVPNTNLRYGLGGTGDPTTGREAQSPTSWTTGDWGFMWDGDLHQQGLGQIATLFGRGDTQSGVSTAAASAPKAYWELLAQSVGKGIVRPSGHGWQILREMGYTPEGIGGAAPAEHAAATTGQNIRGVDFNPGGATPLGPQAGGAGGAGGGASGSDSSLQDYYATITANEQAKQAAALAYQDWLQRTHDDEQAFQHAQQTYENTWNEKMFGYQQTKDQWALQQSAGYFDVNGQRQQTLAGQAQEAAITGYLNGKPTYQREQSDTATTMGLLGLGAQLRGPENYGAYLKTLGSTPQGLRDVVNAAAGRWTMPSTTGMTPGTQQTPASVQGLLNDVSSGAQNAQADWTQALSGGLPNPNQLNLRNYSSMLPSQRAMLGSAYETQGWDLNDFNAMVAQSRPTGTGGQTGTFKF